MMRRCFSCFKEYNEKFDVCPHCGQPVTTAPNEPIHLAPGTVLANRYILGTSVGSGGFGIVYKAWDTKLETIVAVKEFFVSRLVTRAEGLKDLIVTKKAQQEYNYRKERFLAEARNMAKFGAHRNIPNVFEFFEENNTAYIVMELLNGMSLSDYMKQNPEGIDIDFAILIANEVGAALRSLHESGIVHRDVAPDNIYICSDREIRIKLMDLGAAKLADSTDNVVDIILKPGYSPTEQYDKSKNIGPWTDIYALGATLYVLLTGVKPDESTNRKISDEVVPPNQINPDISENLSNTVMKAMAVEKHMRFKNIDEFLKALNGEKKIVSVEKEKKRRKARRYYGIIAACLMLISVFSVVYGTYSQKKAQETLEPATIEMWYYSYDESKINNIVSYFNEVYPDVTIKTKNDFLDEAHYKEELLKCAKNEDLPDLFESSGVDPTIISKATDISSVLESEAAKDCLFLDQYSNYYSNFKKIPLAIEAPVICTKVTSSGTYNNFDDINEIGSDIFVDERAIELVQNNFGTWPYYDIIDIGIIATSTLYIHDIEEEWIKVDAVYPKSKEVYCNFICEWSIGSDEEKQIKAAKMLLSWMLSKRYQECMFGGTSFLCLNKDEFMIQMKDHKYKNIVSVYKNFVFER